MLASEAFGGYGGIARFNRDFAAALAARGDVGRIDLLPRVALDREGTPGGVVQHPPRRGRAAYSLAATRLAAERPDVVVNAHLYHSPLSRLLARVTGAHLVSVLHGTEVWGALPIRLLRPLAASDAVLCVSRDTETRILTAAPALAGRTAVTYNTVGMRFRPGDRDAARMRFGVGHAFVVLTVARLDTRKREDGRFYKGHDRIIPVLKALPVDRHVLYLVAGTGGDRPRLEALARATGVADQVRFLGKVDDADLPDLYRAADLFVLPSTGEGFGIVYLEAMASGVPAIGLDVGGAPDALSAHPLGMAVPPEDFEAGFKRAAAAATALTHEERGILSQAVHDRFGEAAFRMRVDRIVEKLYRK